MQRHEIEYILKLRDEMTKTFDRVNSSIEEFDSQLKNANRRMRNEVPEAQKQTAQSTDRLMSSVKALGLAYAGLELVKFAGEIVNAGAKVERLEAQFKPLLGSTEAAKQRIEELTDFTARTPFQIEGTASASRILETLTGGVLSTEDGLRLVGDAAAQSGEDFANLSTHVGRAYSALTSNRAAGESLARLQELGLLTGQARNEVERLQQAARGREAWEVLQAELAKSNGAMLELSQTFDGKVSTMKDNWDRLLVSISNSGAVLKIAKNGVDLLTESIQFWTKAIDSGAGKSAITRLAEETNKASEELIDVEKRLQNARRSFGDEGKITQHLQAQVDAKRKLIEENTKEIAQLQKKSVVDKENKRIALEQTQAEQARVENARKYAEERIKIEGQVGKVLEATANKREEIGKTKDEIEILRTRQKFDRLIELAKNHKDLVKKLEDARELEISDVELQQQMEKNRKIQEEVKKHEEKMLEVKRLYDFEASLIDMNEEEQEIARINAKFEKEKALLIQHEQDTKNLEAVRQAEITRIQEKASDDRIKAVERENEQKLRATQVGLKGLQDIFALSAANDRRARIAFKTAAIADAVINTYVGANKALAAFPPPFNFIAAGGVVATGLANVAKIKQQRFENGGIVGGTNFTGDNVGVRVNSGEMILNRRQQRQLFAVAQGRGGVGGRSGGAVTVQGGPISITVGAGMNAQEVGDLVAEKVNQANLQLAAQIRRNQEFGVTA